VREEETEDTKNRLEGAGGRIARARSATGSSPSWVLGLPVPYANGRSHAGRIRRSIRHVRYRWKTSRAVPSARRARGGARACGAAAERRRGFWEVHDLSSTPSRSSRTGSESVARKRSSTSQRRWPGQSQVVQERVDSDAVARDDFQAADPALRRTAAGSSRAGVREVKRS